MTAKKTIPKPTPTCFPRVEGDIYYFRIFRDEDSWVGWVPKVFSSAFRAYLSEKKSDLVSIEKIASAMSCDFVCIRSRGAAMSYIIYVILRRLAGDIKKPSEFLGGNFYEFAYLKAAKARRTLLQKRTHLHSLRLKEVSDPALPHLTKKKAVRNKSHKKSVPK